ncbi:putative efflux protein, MATE family [Pelagirhabdus alkalitolerans]|uniref:Probable multidrug resistance protein NorM n=1 Tax=Pelagirhabdus alkalitolerans TaxID=1612202 RepID=A0A1G6GN51_9BACI|nr:MATE family efflux transporter [Pelagirhabdus alkalitolerans]SDB83368.1 putative efflux protein, MATE family [Pelagirhabdus alkalitolerans]
MNQDMTTGRPFKLIMFFTLPMLLGNIFQQFYSMADTFIVSQTLGMDALAAVGSTGSIMFFILGLAIGLTAGLAVITAQRFGKKDEVALRKSLGVSVIIAAVASLLITIIATANTRNILEFMQTPPEIIDQAYDYLVVIFAGIGATVMFNFLSNILRAIGDSRTPLIFLIITSLLNIILDYVFILGFGMNVAGAGYATIISQLIASILCLIYIKRYVRILRVRKEDWTLEWSEYKAHLRIGLPYGFQYSIIAIGSIAVQMTLNQLGALSVAAFTAASKIDQLLTMPLQTFGVTMSTFTAQNFGAKQFDRIKQGIKTGLTITLSYALLIGLFLFFTGRFWSSFFVDEGGAAVLDLTEQFFHIQAPFYLFLALVFVLRHTIQGLGNSFAPTLAGIMELLARVFGALTLSQAFGFSGAIMANPLAWISAVIPLGSSYVFTQKLLNGDTSKLAYHLSIGSKEVLRMARS